MMAHLTRDPIALDEWHGAAVDRRDGASVEFLGIVRGEESGRPISHLDYEAYEPMAQRMIDRLVEQAYAAFGRIDILVNNAGLSPLAPSSAETPETLFDKVVGLNFKGPFRLTAIVGSRMAAGNGGSIINISSTGSIRPRPEFIPYAGAKAALNAITRGFAFEFGPKVRVNVILPGRFLTDISKAWTEEARQNRGSALGRSGRPEEIVTTALYLASDASSFTTGAEIRVDGGTP